ncbi:IclR family transcriptional regulator domain-containing protein [Agrobacterium tumefaciens]|uniref:IclR family transcriptional regulator domain-containing protein n=1 Tax=Agrobacterium tumefaciens TaxID=358 RepID=UPI00157498C4|nr:hypothetical protein [Agrobacterium tumefaciens]
MSIPNEGFIESKKESLLGERFPLRYIDIYIVSIFRDYFASDTTLSPYTATLTLLGDRVVYIGCRNSDQPLRHSFRIGMRLLAPYTATGKILLSELPDDELTALFSSGLCPRPQRQKGQEPLNAPVELVEERARGFSIDDGQIRE